VEVDRAEHLLRGGEPLVDRMPANLRFEIALFVAGGLSILSAIRRLDYDVWRKRPRLSRMKRLGLLTRCWWHTKWPSAERPTA
jgi:phytoene/squalene synthetase